MSGTQNCNCQWCTIQPPLSTYAVFGHHRLRAWRYSCLPGQLQFCHESLKHKPKPRPRIPWAFLDDLCISLKVTIELRGGTSAIQGDKIPPYKQKPSSLYLYNAREFGLGLVSLPYPLARCRGVLSDVSDSPQCKQHVISIQKIWNAHISSYNMYIAYCSSKFAKTPVFNV